MSETQKNINTSEEEPWDELLGPYYEGTTPLDDIDMLVFDEHTELHEAAVEADRIAADALAKVIRTERFLEEIADNHAERSRHWAA